MGGNLAQRARVVVSRTNFPSRGNTPSGVIMRCIGVEAWN